MARAKALLTEHMDKLHAMAQALVRYETLTSEQIDAIMDDAPLSDPDQGDDVRDSGSPDGAGPDVHRPAPRAPRLSAQPVAEHFEAGGD